MSLGKDHPTRLWQVYGYGLQCLNGQITSVLFGFAAMRLALQWAHKTWLGTLTRIFCLPFTTSPRSEEQSRSNDDLQRRHEGRIRLLQCVFAPRLLPSRDG
jgi:hypothetical protein